MVAALPSPQSKPVIGHLSHFLVPKAIDFYRKILDSSFEFDQTIKLWIGPILAVIIQDKDHIQAVLECVDKPIIYESLPVFSHNGLVTSKGDWSGNGIFKLNFHTKIVCNFRNGLA